ncbi:lon protease [Bifidobacterium sp. DSM 109960]|uniref:endopeptidase La n=2 Tax=Bifidobacterium erythrocebi TaxID=2675325 RepID=A0A7Y0ESM6_9BIFI|nr:lon protease [Bifidobacterium sp. DSM 109960]
MHGMSHTSLPSRIVWYFRARSPRYLAGLIAVALCLVVLCLPSAYSVEMPGPTQNVLGSSSGKQVIAVSNARVYHGKGKLLLTTVNASGLPGYPVTNAEVLWALFDPHAIVMPREVVVPTGQTAEEYESESAKEMKDSQSAAVKAAKNMLRKRGVDVSGVKVRMHVDDIGGPSAGMMYTLGLIDKLTPQDETGGKTIAGTGTIDAKGKVGEIGGIRLKMIGAKRDGATWFLAPKGNCDEVVGHVPAGMRDVAVSTIDEAYDAVVAIGKGKGASLPHCTAARSVKGTE